jgi:hypothetical protein
MFMSNLYLLAPSQFALLSQARVYDNEANPCGPVYITIGDGGNREGLAFK